MRMNQTKEWIYADDVLIADGVELPLQMSDFFTYNMSIIVREKAHIINPAFHTANAGLHIQVIYVYPFYRMPSG